MLQRNKYTDYGLGVNLTPNHSAPLFSVGIEYGSRQGSKRFEDYSKAAGVKWVKEQGTIDTTNDSDIGYDK